LHSNDVAIVELVDVRVGAVTHARAGFWVYRDTATGAMGLQFRPQLDANLAGIGGFAGDVNLSIPTNGQQVNLSGLSRASGDALAYVKAVLAHAPELLAAPTSVDVGAGSTIGQPAALASALDGLRTAMGSGDAQFFAFAKSMNAEWLGISVAMHYDSYSDPTVRTHVCTEPFVDAGGTVTPCTFADADLVSFIGRARAQGFKIYITLAFESSAVDDPAGNPTCHTTQFKMPRFLLGAPEIPEWAAAGPCIPAGGWWWNPSHPNHAANVQTFWSTYQQVAMKYAALAESTGVELFSVGTETEHLFRTRSGTGAYTNHFLPQLQSMVAAVRGVYGGAVTYDQHYEPLVSPQVYGGGAGNAHLFSDLGLDVIGVSAYFPLASAAVNQVMSVAQFETAWTAVFNTYLKPLAAGNPGKPIVFTEVGYTDDLNSPFRPASNESAPKPSHATGTATPGMTQQANIYQAFYNVNAREGDLVAGAFWWGNDYFPTSGLGCDVVMFGLYCNAPAKQVVTDAYTAWKRQDADRVFSWAASVYPGLFNGAITSGTIAGYYYRHHAGTGIYLGLQESTDNIYVHDFGAFNFMNVGALRGYLDLAGRAGY
jgi:hypothetical protein